MQRKQEKKNKNKGRGEPFSGFHQISLAWGRLSVASPQALLVMPRPPAPWGTPVRADRAKRLTFHIYNYRNERQLFKFIYK